LAENGGEGRRREALGDGPGFFGAYPVLSRRAAFARPVTVLI